MKSKYPVSLWTYSWQLEDEGQYDLSKELIQETERMNFLVNQVLHMSRASSYSQDFIVEKSI